MIPPKRFDISPPLTGGCSEGLDAFRFFFEIHNIFKNVKYSPKPVAPVFQLVTSKNLETFGGWDVSSNLGAVTRTGIFPRQVK